MITSAVVQQPSVAVVVAGSNNNTTEEEKKKHENHSDRGPNIDIRDKTTTEKGIAVVVRPEIHADRHSSGSSNSGDSGRSSNDNSSDGDSFESLFNGSTYYVDEYFNSIGYDGGSGGGGSSSISSTGSTGSCSTPHHIHMQCRSIISGRSVGECDDVYYDNHVNPHYNNHMNGNASIDVESADMSPSSSVSSTLNGLIIPNDASSSSSLSMSTATVSPNNNHTNAVAMALTNNLDVSLTPTDEKKLPETTKSSNCRVKIVLLLEKIVVATLLLAIFTGCMITILAMARHLRHDHSNKNPSAVSVPGVVTSSNNDTTTTGSSSNNHTANDDERLFHIRNIVRGRYGETAFDPIPGTPQHDALIWMAYVDVPSILGHDVQLRIPPNTNDTNQTEAASLWNTYLSIRVTQRYVLLLFFFHNIGTEHLMLGGWASLTGARLTECIWPGITCRTVMAGARTNTELSVVTEFEVHPWIAHLHGSIPTEIGLLQHLETLVLSDNSLTGNLPSELYTLQKLHTLRISNTSIASALSPDIGNLTDMTFLDLSNNSIGSTIPTELGWLTNLQYINLAQNNFSGTIPTELGSLQVLQNLFLEDNSLHGIMPSAICSLPSFHRLQELHADCWVAPFKERSFCDLAKTQVLCDCCTYCF